MGPPGEADHSLTRPASSVCAGRARQRPHVGDGCRLGMGSELPLTLGWLRIVELGPERHGLCRVGQVGWHLGVHR